MVKYLGIIQARLSSSRLPAKVMLDLGGKPLLGRVLESVKQSTLMNQVIVATSVEASDDIIADYCASIDVVCFRGELNNVLSRFYHAAQQYQAENVIRITADNPLTSPVLIDWLIDQFEAREADYVFCTGQPYGAGAEVLKFSALEQAYRQASDEGDLEHVTSYIRQNFNSLDLEVGQPYCNTQIRVTIDTLDDYVRMARFAQKSPDFSLEQYMLYHANHY